MRWAVLLVLATFSATFANAAIGPAKSPFTATGEILGLLETSETRYVLELDLAKLYARRENQLWDFRTVEESNETNTVWRVWKISRSDSNDRVSYPAVIEQLADGNSTIAAFRSGGATTLLYIPSKGRRERRDSLDYGGRRWGFDPQVLEGETAVAATFAFQYSMHESVTSRLAEYLPQEAAEAYRAGGDFPNWSEAERDALREQVMRPPKSGGGCAAWVASWFGKR